MLNFAWAWHALLPAAAEVSGLRRCEVSGSEQNKERKKGRKKKKKEREKETDITTAK